MRNKTIFRAISAVVLATGTLFLSAWLVAAGSECTWLTPLAALPGLAWVTLLLLAAVVSLPPLDTVFTKRTSFDFAQDRGKRGLAHRTIISGALSMGLAAAILLSLDATFSGILLVYYFGLWLAADYLRRLAIRDSQFATRNSPLATRHLRLAAYFDDVLHAPFIISALLLLIVTAINLAAGREPNAERLANWAYGFLVLGVGTALINQIQSSKPKLQTPDNAPRFTHHPSASFGSAEDRGSGQAVSRFTSHFSRFTSHLSRHTSYVTRFAPVFGLAMLLLVVGYALAREEVSKRIPSPLPEAVVQAGNLAGPDDLILGVGLDYPLRCAYRGEGTVKILAADAIAGFEPELARLLSARRKVFVIFPGDTLADSPAATFDRLEAVPAPDLPVTGLKIYAPPLTAADLRPLNGEGEFYSVTGEVHPGDVASADFLTALVRLQLASPATRHPSPDSLVGLMLLDDRGYVWASSLKPMADTNGVPSALWGPDEIHDVRLVLRVPMGTPPVTYTVALAVRPQGAPGFVAGRSAGMAGQTPLPAGEVVPLGEVKVVRPRHLEADPYRTFFDIGGRSVDLTVGPGTLVYSFDERPYQPGEHLYLTLLWRGRLPTPDDVHLRLRSGGRVFALYDGPPAGGRYPFNLRRSDEYGVDHYDLELPLDLPRGEALLELSTGDRPAQTLGPVQIRSGPRLFSPPAVTYPASAAFGGVAELVGYDLSQAQIRPAETMTVTLYWKAISAQPIVYPYTVFVHLTGEDPAQLIAQHDGPPADGTRPTTDWALGEYIRDVHVIPIPADAPVGEAWLRVGLYRLDTLERLPLREEAETEWRLPTAIVIR